MTYCGRCGAVVNDSGFCHNCGNSIAAANLGGFGFGGAEIPERQRSLMEMKRMIQYFGAMRDWYTAYDSWTNEIMVRKEKNYLGWLIGGAGCFVISLISKAGFFLFATVVLIGVYVMLYMTNKSKIDAANEQLAQIKAQLLRYYEGYGYCPIGIEYTWPSDLNTINNMISSGRASSPGQAINLILADQRAEQLSQYTQRAAIAAENMDANTVVFV